MPNQLLEGSVFSEPGQVRGSFIFVDEVEQQIDKGYGATSSQSI